MQAMAGFGHANGGCFVKILFFDDERWRHDLFEPRERGNEIHHAYTVRQFKHAISRHVFDMISFDYDITDDKSETGMDAVNALLATPGLRWPNRVVVHSWNSRGAGEMVARFREAGVEPERCAFESKMAGLASEAERRFSDRNGES